MNCIRRLQLAGLLLLAASVAPARGALVADATAYLADLQRVSTSSTQVATDRTAMATDIDNPVTLTADVKTFFFDRVTVALAEMVTTADRKMLKHEARFKGLKMVKPGTGTGILNLDATAYLADFDTWTALGTQIQTDLDTVQAAVTANDATALKAALLAYFTDRHARFQANLNATALIHALKKDVAFKPTGKAVKPQGTLHNLVNTFLDDRATWVTQEATLPAARDAIRTALSSSGDVEGAVSAFLSARRAHFVQGRQLAFDRQSLRAVVKVKGKDVDPQPPKDDNGAEQNPQLDGTSSVDGE